jgi:CubicO group peptidase (beta-lactamase class C family)
MQRLLAGIVYAAVLLSITPFHSLVHAQPMAFPQSEWERVSPESQFVQSALLRKAVDRLETQTSSGGGVEELVVIRNGRMIWDGPQSNYAHHTWSMTKSFASTALGLLVDDAQVTLDTLAQETVPAMAADYPEVTLRHLVTQTSGYKFVGEPYGVVIPDYAPTEPFTPGTPLFTPAGSQFAYGSSLDQLMNVLTQVAGEPIQDLFQRRLGDSMGLAPEAWDWGDFAQPSGIAVDGGSGYHTKGVSISAQDAARLGHLFLNRGNWNGQQLISSEWVDEATRVQVPASTPLYSASPTDGPGIYGYAWWVNGVDPWGQRLFHGVPESTYVAWGYQSNLLIA